MSPPLATERLRERLHSTAIELVALAETFEPTPGAPSLEPELISKARDLIAQAQTPMDYALSLVTSTMDTATIHTLLHLNALQAIPASGSIDLDALAKMTNTQSALLERLLRVLVGSGFIHQRPDGSYAHTHRSAGFGKDSFPGYLFSFLCESGLDAFMRLPEYLEVKRKGTTTAETPNGWVKEPDSATHNPSTWSYGQEGRTIFEIMEEQDPAKLQRFQKIMGSMAGINPYVGFYDYGKLATPDPARPVFVDVGGGHGHAIQHMLEAHPEISAAQCVLQDTQKVIDSAANGNPNLPAAVQFQAHDYFTLQPVKHARAHHLRAIAHDLGDENLVRVLKQIVPARAPDSRVLIADNVLPERGTQGLSAFSDMMMLVIGGKERTERDFREVCEKAGLTVKGVHRTAAPRTYAIVEAGLR